MPPPPPPRKGKSGGLGPGPPLPGGGPGPPAGTKLQPNWAFWRNQRKKKKEEKSCEKVCCERFESGFWGLVWVLVDKLTCILIASWKACNEAECAAPKSKTQAWAHWWLAGCPVCIRVCHGFCSPMILHLSISRMKNQHMETICWKNLWHGDRPFFFADACECSILHKRATNQVVNLSESTSHQSPAPDDRNEKADYWPFNPTNHLSPHFWGWFGRGLGFGGGPFFLNFRLG